MTDDIIAKALALVNEVKADYNEYPHLRPLDDTHEALCRAIEHHEAYKQEVSEFALGVREYMALFNVLGWQEECNNFIIPKPKPDPLLEAVGEAMQKHEVYSKYELTDSIRAGLDARGLEIREKGETK